MIISSSSYYSGKGAYVRAARQIGLMLGSGALIFLSFFLSFPVIFFRRKKDGNSSSLLPCVDARAVYLSRMYAFSAYGREEDRSIIKFSLFAFVLENRVIK